MRNKTRTFASALLALALAVCLVLGIAFAARPARAEGENPNSKLTPWNQLHSNNDKNSMVTLLDDGNAKIDITKGEYGARASYDYAIDFATAEWTMDLTDTITGSYPNYLYFAFVKGMNAYVNDGDTGSLLISMQKVDDNTLNILLHHHWFEIPYADASGVHYQTAVDVSQNKKIVFKIEKTETSVNFCFNDAKISCPATDFYGKDRKLFNSEGDNFDGSRYLIAGTINATTTLQTPMSITMSPLRDKTTLAYEESIESDVAKVDEYVEAAEALSGESVADDVLAVDDMGEALRLDENKLRAYTINIQNRRIAAAEALVAVQRERLKEDLLSKYISRFHSAARIIRDKATLASAEIALGKVNLSVLENMPDGEEKNAVIKKLDDAKDLMQFKIDEVADGLISDLEDKTVSLDSTSKLRAAILADAQLDPGFVTKIGPDNIEAFNVRILTARGKISSAGTLEQYKVNGGMAATKTANETLGLYSATGYGNGAASTFLNAPVNASNVNLELKVGHNGGGFIAVEFMQKKEDFINSAGPEVAGNPGIVLKISQSSPSATSYDVTLYNIKLTSANGFEGAQVTIFSVPIREDGVISVTLLEEKDNVALIVNGVKKLDMTKLAVKSMFGAEFKAYLGILSTFGGSAEFDPYYEMELTKINGKNVFAPDVANPVVVEATGVSINKSSALMAIDDGIMLIATITPTDATDKSVTWTSSDEDVAIVDESGYVTALAEGTATITATTSNGKTVTCKITVTKDGKEPEEKKGGCGSKDAASAGLIVLLAAAGIACKRFF